MAASSIKYRLGLDMGTNSIGWAAVRIDEKGNPVGVLDMGVRIFPDGRDEQSKQSNAVDRRVARGQRRRRDRYLQRRRDLMQALTECGLMPSDSNERKALESLEPYELRARALDQPLQRYELGRALFQLDQRRGFKSNRKTAGADEKEDGKVRAEISELRRRIKESGARTLGEFLERRRKKGKSVLARPGEGLYPDRALYEDEFNAIREAQESNHSPSAGEWDHLRDIIFFQRDLQPVKPGWCQFEFENNEKRAAKALPVFQEFRMLQEVNNLRVRVGIEPERPLDEQERARAMKRLRSGGEIKLSEGRDNKPAKPTGDLGLPSDAVFNLAAGGRKSVKGDETTAKLAAAGSPASGKRPAKPALFGKKWLNLSLDKRNEIVHFLLGTEEPEKVRRKTTAEWGLNDEQADAVANVSLVSGYGNLSEKAIGKILPHLEDGWGYYDAVVKAGYQFDSRNAEAHDSLPYYGVVLERDAVGADPTKDPERDGEPARYGRIANPTVHIGLGQLRRVVNRLIEVYGKPEEIVVELARELKWNREQKAKHQKQRDDNEKQRKHLEKTIRSMRQEPTRDAIQKLRLWEEQGPIQARVCPYTGQQISCRMALSAETEVDHILPFSRTLDDSMSNKVVCIADANQVKGNQTPYEAFGDRCLQYVADFPANKLWRFQKDAMERFEGENGFLARQLNETQYLSRTARTYLAYLYDEQGEGRQRVRATPGRMTALLRRGWGLEGMFDGSAETETPRKTRDDHRHHAIDAFVVANTTQGLLHRFAQAAGSDYRGAAERLAALVPPPWQGFDRNEVRQHLDKLVVSYKPDHGTRGAKGKTTGQLHNDTAYGIINLVKDGPSEVVARKALSTGNNGWPKTAKHLEAVRDPALRAALLELWHNVADGGKNQAGFVQEAKSPGVPLDGKRQPVQRVRVVEKQTVIPIKDGAGKYYKGYLPGGNEFADIWRMPDGSWQMVVVSTFDANQPAFNIDDKRPHPAAKRLMRLQINDIGALGEGADRRIVRVRQMDNSKSGPRVVLDDHNEANVPARISKDARIRKETGVNTGMKLDVYSAQKLRRLGFRKVRVDELGRVRDRGPFQQ